MYKKLKNKTKKKLEKGKIANKVLAMHDTLLSLHHVKCFLLNEVSVFSAKNLIFYFSSQISCL